MPRERVFPGLHPILLPDEPQEELTKKCLGQIVANSSPIALWGGNDTWDVGGESRARGLQLLGVWCCCQHHFLLGFSSISEIPIHFSLNKFSSLCCCYYSASAWIGLSAQNKILQKIPVTLSKGLFGLKVQLEGRKGTAVHRGGIPVFIPRSKAAGEVTGQTLI